MHNWMPWLNERIGIRLRRKETVSRPAPGEPRWRYAWGPALVFLFILQLLTGLYLSLFYRDSAQIAWLTVFHIEHQLAGGWLVRGLHYWGGQIMILVAILHFGRIVFDRAYVPPRELQYWLGLVVFVLVVGLAITGEVLPWDQSSLYLTRSLQKLSHVIPVPSSFYRRLLLGLNEYDPTTLTRMFTFHVYIMPAIALGLIGLHLYLRNRLGSAPAKWPASRVTSLRFSQRHLNFWVCSGILLFVVLFTFFGQWLDQYALYSGSLWAPLDPETRSTIAGAPWYLWPLRQILRWFMDAHSIWLDIMVWLWMIFLLAVPWIGRLKYGHISVLSLFMVAWFGSIVLGIRELRVYQANIDNYKFVADAKREADRTQLIAYTLPGHGDVTSLDLLRNDPLLQGPKLFAKFCSGCHRYQGHDGSGHVPVEESSASDLYGFASRAWLEGFLDPQLISTPKYFGGTKFKNGKMAIFTKLKVAKYSTEDKKRLKKAIVALSAEAALPYQMTFDQNEVAKIKEGFGDIKDQLGCIHCHCFHMEDEGLAAPKLTGYGSKSWIMGIIHNPAHKNYYGVKNDRMPAFGAQQILDAQAIGALADWLRGDWAFTQTNHPPSWAAQR